MKIILFLKSIREEWIKIVGNSLAREMPKKRKARQVEKKKVRSTNVENALAPFPGINAIPCFFAGVLGIKCHLRSATEPSSTAPLFRLPCLASPSLANLKPSTQGHLDGFDAG